MYIVKKTKKADYGYYFKAFSSSHYRLYGESQNKNLKEYITKLVLVEYENVYKFIFLKDSKHLGFFHIYIQKDIAEISTGLFDKLNTIYGVYLNIIATKTAFDLHNNVNIALAKIHKDNIQNHKIMKAIGGEKVCIDEERFVFKLNKNNFPNEFAVKILSKIERKGLKYEK